MNIYLDDNTRMTYQYSCKIPKWIRKILPTKFVELPNKKGIILFGKKFYSKKRIV